MIQHQAYAYQTVHFVFEQLLNEELTIRVFLVAINEEKYRKENAIIFNFYLFTPVES